jgi:hypothetical protein
MPMDAPLFFEETRRRLGWTALPESGWGCLELKEGAQSMTMRPLEPLAEQSAAEFDIHEAAGQRSYVTSRLLRWPFLQQPLSLAVTSGIPRSGTGWLDRLARRLCSWVSSKKGTADFQGKRADDFPLNDLGDSEHRRLLAFLHTYTKPEPACLKTHFLAGMEGLGEGARWLYIYRDPRDVITSSAHWYLYGPCQADGTGEREALLDSHLRWLMPRMEQSLEAAVCSDSTQCLLVSYESLQVNAPAEIERIAWHLGISLPKGMSSCIANRHSFQREAGRPNGVVDSSSYYRRGLVGGWEEDLFPSMEVGCGRFYRRISHLLPELHRRCSLQDTR